MTKRIMPAAFAAVAALSIGACVKAPNVAVVDSKTALEKQAAGEYPALENDLEQAGLAPRPEPFPREELVAGRNRSGGGALGEVAELYAKAESDADKIDALLVKKCVGEATSGFLEARPADCTAAVDTAEMTRLLGRSNLHRRQVWQMIATERATDIEKARRAWRPIHLEQVVCGGLIQTDDGWKPKAC